MPLTTQVLQATVTTPQHYEQCLWHLFLLPLVLVAHNGYRFDFPILLSEIQRRPKSFNFYNLFELRLHFADTLGHLRQVQFTANYNMTLYNT